MIWRSEVAPVEGISGGDDKELRQKLRIQAVAGAQVLLPVLWLPQLWEHLLSFHCRRGNQPRAPTAGGWNTEFGKLDFVMFGGICDLKNSLVYLLAFVSVAAQMQEWLITDISCSPRLNVSAWPQNQLWKTRCFFNYLKDSEDKQPDLVSSLIWIEKYTLLCSPDKRTEHLQPAKCYFLIPLTCPGLKTSTRWGEIVF